MSNVKEKGKPAHKVVKLSEQQMVDGRELVSEAISNLIHKEPFYGLFFMRFNREITTKIPTAAVAIKKNKIWFMFNPIWLGKFSLPERKAVVKHEIFHLLLEHLTRLGDRDAYISNIAMDAAINQYIDDLPNEGISIEGLNQQYPRLKLKPERSWEEYYDALHDEAEEQKKEGNQGPSGDGDVFGQTMDDHGNWSDSEENEGRAPGEDGEMGASVRDLISDQVKQAANEVASQCRQAGRLPGEIQELIDRMNAKAKINWRTVLRRWFAASVDFDRRNSFMRESRKVEGVFPGRRRYPKPDFHIWVDTSGSVGQEEYNALMTEIDGICSAFKVDCNVHFFDVRVWKSVKHKKGMNHERTHGGTDFDVVFDHAKELKQKRILIFTDGGSSISDYRGITPLWVFIPDYWKGADEFKGKKVVIDDLDYDN